MPAKIKVRYVRFTPEEMAIDVADVDASKAPIIARGRKEWLEFLSFKRGYFRLEPELRKVFPDDMAVNKALRKVAEILEIKRTERRRKSA